MIYITTIKIKRKGVPGYLYIYGTRRPGHPTPYAAAMELVGLINRHLGYGDRFVEGFITLIEESNLADPEGRTLNGRRVKK